MTVLEFAARSPIVKKQYEPPRLVTYGELRSLTQGGSGLVTETNCGGMNEMRTPRTNC